MEITEAAINALDPLMEQFYTPIDLSIAVQTVTNHFYIMIAVILSVYPFLYIFRQLIRYCEKAFDTDAVRKLEGKGMWDKLPDGSLYSGLEKIANIRVFDRYFRRK